MTILWRSLISSKKHNFPWSTTPGILWRDSTIHNLLFMSWRDADVLPMRATERKEAHNQIEGSMRHRRMTLPCTWLEGRWQNSYVVASHGYTMINTSTPHLHFSGTLSSEKCPRGILKLRRQRRLEWQEGCVAHWWVTSAEIAILICMCVPSLITLQGNSPTLSATSVHFMLLSSSAFHCFCFLHFSFPSPVPLHIHAATPGSSSPESHCANRWLKKTSIYHLQEHKHNNFFTLLTGITCYHRGTSVCCHLVSDLQKCNANRQNTSHMQKKGKYYSYKQRMKQTDTHLLKRFKY